MATKTVAVRFRSFLPGAGFNSAGSPKQGKTRVVGQISVTSYGGGEGEPLVASDIGLSVIDSIQLRVHDEVDGALSGSGKGSLRGVSYVKTTGHFYLWKVNDAGALTPVGATSTETVEFDAFGDSAADIELN